MKNITVAVGREAILSCVVDHLGNYKVAWIKVDTQTILTIHTHVISHNHRIAASHNGHRIWNLHIRDVQEDDSGYYMCQLNTAKMQSQTGLIEVVVPPDIIYEESSSDEAVVEGGNVLLVCKATGHPQPKVIWRREDGRPIILKATGREKVKMNFVEGEMLNITKITRKQMGAYLCIAANGVPPSISKRIYVQVNFKPKVKLPNQVLAAPVGTEVTLECHIEASPKPVNLWTKENGGILISSVKYLVEEFVDAYEIIFQVKIRELEEKDLGFYNCTSKNLLGEAEGSMRLIEIGLPTSKPKTDWLTKESTMHIQMTGRTEDKKIETSQGGPTAHNSKQSKVLKSADSRGRAPKSDAASGDGNDVTPVRPVVMATALLLLYLAYMSGK